MFKLSCKAWNPRHVRFNVFDPAGANCGELTILVSDVADFARGVWNGIVVWNGLLPAEMEVEVAK